MNKKTAMEQLTTAHDELYEADQLLGNMRITKETAECLRLIAIRIATVDKLITAAMDNLT